MASSTKLTESFEQFFAYLSDQMGHLDHANAYGAEYVGRRLDQHFRWLEYEVMRWIDERYEQPGGDNDDPATDARAAIGLLREIYRETSSRSIAEAHSEAFVHLRAVDLAARNLFDAINRGDVRAAAIASHVARRAFSAYRLAKYRWLDEALERGDLPGDNSYRWLEA